MRAKLKIKQGSNSGRIFEVTVPQFVIGRAPGCNLRPQSDAISRQHCAILLHDQRVTVRDLKSRNGTFLNGEALTSEEVLDTGDELQVGPLIFEVVITKDDGTVHFQKGPDPAERQVGGLPSDSGMISDWLMEEDHEAQVGKTAVDKETRQFQIDESTFITAESVAKETAADKKKKKAKEDDSKFGKLPKLEQNNSASSKEAAADTLRKMFNRNS